MTNGVSRRQSSDWATAGVAKRSERGGQALRARDLVGHCKRRDRQSSLRPRLERRAGGGRVAKECGAHAGTDQKA
jgi:hypothetical protein